MTDPIILYALLAALIGIFWLGALDKARHFMTFEMAVAGYRLLPATLIRPFAAAFIVAEGLAGILLLIPGLRTTGAGLALLVLAVSTLGIAINLLRGNRDIDCGCGGLAQGTAGLSWWLVGRNVLLGVFAGLMLPLSALDGRPLGWLDGVTFVGVALAVLGLYFVFNQLIESHLRIQKSRSLS